MIRRTQNLYHRGRVQLEAICAQKMAPVRNLITKKSNIYHKRVMHTWNVIYCKQDFIYI